MKGSLPAPHTAKASPELAIDYGSVETFEGWTVEAA